MKNFNIILPVLATLLISACSSGSSDSPDEQTNADNPLTGRFVDSAVVGLPYETATRSGVTGSDGSFSYLAGESVTFSLGDISLPATPGAQIITPLDVFGTDDITDVRVMNLARLLQTLDTNADPTDGITLSSAATASASGLQVDFSASEAEFGGQVVNLVANSGSSNTELVNGIEALDHLQETLFVEGIDERPPLPMPMQPGTVTTPDTQNTSDHPAVGRSGEFSDIAHDVSGTLTVIDDRTLQITNFNYDGDGVVVFFYTGTDGNYAAGEEIGLQLNGRPYVNETITLTIPDNLTLDDFNGISVWCVPFFANFGDARF